MASVDPYALVDQGLQVFPIQIINPGTDEKQFKFLTQHWNEDASSDPAIIAQWIAKFGKKITDWGIPTGHRAGFVAIDIDSDEANHWWESKWLPEGMVVDTPRGGKHVYYSLDGVDADIKTCQNEPFHGIDIRGEGGFVVAYSNDFSDIPEMPDSVLEILPEKQSYSSDPIPENIEKATDVTPQEERVLKGLTDMLDALPVPWRKGAGYHDTQFMVACGLNRIANSPYFATNRDQAHALFLKHAPLRDSADAQKRDRRWSDAVEITAGQYFEAPSDVPIRLDAIETLDKFIKASTERLFWESKNVGDVKDLIRELREAGATEQEAYSVSYECAAMKNFRKKNPEHSTSTWGYVKSIYGETFSDDGSSEKSRRSDDSGISTNSESEEWRLLTSAERDLIRVYPNFIDRYILAAREIFPEPNLPLHYVNAWIGLSCAIGDRADIVLEKGRVPMSLWGLVTAPSAAGKGDAKGLMIDFIESSRRGGYSEINAGGDASAEALTAFVSEQEGKVAFFNKDEAASILANMNAEGKYEKKMIDLALDLYDGKVSKLLRVGNAKDGVGGRKNTVFNMWLQTTWSGAVGALTEQAAISGFLGRFIVAIGDGAKITRESLTPKFASEYQVSLGGIHPAIKSLGDGVKTMAGRPSKFVITADDDVIDRYVEMRLKVRDMAKAHPLSEHLLGISTRITENMLKAAGLLAVSEGRDRIEMTDLLIAMKSGQYWLRDAIKITEAITTSEYRRHVEDVIAFCSTAPKTKQQVLRAAKFRNEDQRKVSEWLERAEAEGAIVRSQNGKYSSVEGN